MPDAAVKLKSKPLYQRVLVKLSGEALMGGQDYGLEPAMVQRVASEISEIHRMGVQVCMVVGGGNIFRGVSGASAGMERASADYMGMLATVINALALQDALEKMGTTTRVQSALPMPSVCEPYIRLRAERHLQKNRVVIFAAGTGNPFFTTDTAAALRGMEMNVEIVLKATKVDGVYTDDPKTHTDAMRYTRLSFDEAINRKLRVMDATALTLCRDQKLPINVFSIFKPGALRRVIMGEDEGTLVTWKPEVRDERG